jgi:hypothetical protein
MKTTAMTLFLLALLFAPLQASAFNTQTAYNDSDVLSYVAMPLAVSSVCDVRGVQTDRVGELVSYLDQANVAPSDFVDVFRYVPVALVMRTDRRPDFVEWVHDEVDRGVVGPALVTEMERQLRTYDTALPELASSRTYRSRSRYTRSSYRDDAYNDYPYREVFTDEYVPASVHRYCDRAMLDPLALVEMPVAVSNVADLGIPLDRVASLATNLNLGSVPPVQFVEVLRYAPVALVPANGYAPDFVDYVRAQEAAGISGIPLVQMIERQLPVYGVRPQLDLSSPYVYTAGNTYDSPYYSPAPAQYYVPPVYTAYVPQVVQSRVASYYPATAQPVWAAGQAAAPAVAAAPQVQRILNEPGGGAVVTNPGQARRELAHEANAARKAQRFTPQYAPVQAAAPAVAMTNAHHGRGNPHHGFAPNAATPMAAAPRPHGNPRAAAPAMAAPRGYENHPAAPAMAAPAAHGHGNGNGHGRGHAFAAPQAVAPQAAPPPMVMQEHGPGGGGGHQPPGQEKKGKGH